MFDAILLALALAMDSAAVSAARGLSKRGEGKTGRGGEVVVLPLMFGGFQAGMAALGWLLGEVAGKYLGTWDRWIAFALLAGVGIKMLYDARRASPDLDEPDRSGFGVYILLAIATSLDAAAAGITLPMLPVSPGMTIAVIGVVTAACSALGFAAGQLIGGRKLELAGGLVLIGIGIKILVSNP